MLTRAALAAIAAAVLAAALLPAAASAAPSCPPGGTYDKASKTCIAPVNECPPGTSVWEGPSGPLCVALGANPTCADGTVEQNDFLLPACLILTWTCLRDVATGALTCSPEPPTPAECPTGTYREEVGRDYITTSCFVDPTFDCPEGSTYNNTTDQCEAPVPPPCTDPYTLSPLGYCVAAPIKGRHKGGGKPPGLSARDA